MAQWEGTVAAVLLLALAAAATLAIGSADPFVEWAYEGGVFLLAGWVALRRKASASGRSWRRRRCWPSGDSYSLPWGRPFTDMRR